MFRRLRENRLRAGAEILPRCANAACSRLKGIWRRMRDLHGGMALQGKWYCSPQCFETALCHDLAQADLCVSRTPPTRHRIPLGLLMLSRGQLNNRQLRSALDAQKSNGGRIGHWLEELGFATEQQVTAALGLQWACPVLPVLIDLTPARLLPLRLLQQARMIPVRFVAQTRVLYMAFSERVDYSALYAIENMLDCRTEPCIVGHSRMEGALERLGHESRTGEFLFESWREIPEIARIACGYALKLGAQQVRVAACGEYIWSRLQTKEGVTDLLFKRSSFLTEQGRIA